MLLDQNVEFGGQVASCTNAVDLAGEQGRDLRQRGTEEDAGEKGRLSDSSDVRDGAAEIHLFFHPVGHQRVLALRVDVNQDQLALLDGHQAETRARKQKILQQHRSFSLIILRMTADTDQSEPAASLFCSKMVSWM